MQLPDDSPDSQRRVPSDIPLPTNTPFPDPSGAGDDDYSAPDALTMIPVAADRHTADDREASTPSVTDQPSEADTAMDGSPGTILGSDTRSGHSRAVRAVRRAETNRWRPASITAASQITLIAVTVANLATNFDRISYVNFPTAAGLSLLLGVATLILAVARRTIAGPLAVAYGLVFAIRERVNTEPFQGSDVLLATNEAI